MSRRKTNRRTNAHEAAAYREAGHAVAAWRRGIELMPVSIFPNGRGAGRNVWNNAVRNVDFQWVAETGSTRLIERLAAVLLAGPVAQRMFGPRVPRGSVYAREVRETRALLAAVPSSADGAVGFARLNGQTERFLSQKRVRVAVAALAGVLLERGTLTGSEAGAVIAKHLSGA